MGGRSTAEYYRAYRIANKERIAEYRATNAARFAEYDRTYAATPEGRARAKRYRETHREQLAAYQVAWKAAHVERVTAYEHAYWRSHRARLTTQARARRVADPLIYLLGERVLISSLPPELIPLAHSLRQLRQAAKTMSKESR